MTPRHSFVGTFSRLPIVRSPWSRRAVFAALIAICAVLTLFPEKYRAAATLTPTDPGTLGLGGTLGQLGAVSSLFGSQAAVEVSLKVARSEYVRSRVAAELNLEKRLKKSPVETHRWLDNHVDIRALRGSIIEFAVKDRDPEFARELVGAYGTAVSNQLAVISRNQTAQKRKILVEMVDSASERLARAQSAYDSFRLQTRYTAPQSAIYALGDRVPQLEAAIRLKEIDLATLRQFATDENIKVRQALAEIGVLQSQLAQARSTSGDQNASVGRVVGQTTQIDKLRRELDLSQGLYDTYKRYLQGTSVEDLTSSANVRILEPPFIDSARQFNVLPLALGLTLLLLWIAIEFYRIRPPVLDRVPA